VKGQAAVEVIGGCGGKSGGALIQSTMLMIVDGDALLASLVHILGSIVIVIAVMWLFSVLGLSKRFEALKIQSAEEAKTEAAA
jgi:AAA family ATP:ADP antiporter